MLFFKKTKSSYELERILATSISEIKRTYEQSIIEARFKFRKALQDKLENKAYFISITPHPRSFFHRHHSMIERLAGIKAVPGKIISAYQQDEHSYDFNETKYEKTETSYGRQGGIIAFAAGSEPENLTEYLSHEFKRFSIMKDAPEIPLHSTKADIAFAIGKFLNGRYGDHRGNLFDESSLCVEITGIDWDYFYSIALKICRHFKQESVMAKDYLLNETGFMYRE